VAFPEIQKLLDDFDAADRDARAVAEGLSESQGTWRAEPGTWSIAECLDHLAVSNRVYIEAMRGPAERARARGRMRRRPALPGVLGGWFVRSLEPPVQFKVKNPKKSTPRPSPPLADALEAFLASQEEVRRLLRGVADLDLTGTRFPNPYVTAIAWSLATGFHVLAAHDRRHLWQAWNVRRQATAASP
jgi:DinB superfamily